jgi:hypothetical protein
VSSSRSRRGVFELFISFLAAALFIASLLFPLQAPALFPLSGAAALLALYGSIQTWRELSKDPNPPGQRIFLVAALTLSAGVFALVFGELCARLLTALLHHGPRLSPP